jgi:aldehyde:ferredoxin oxidoreductase
MEGRFGAILRVDLSSRKMTKEALDERLLRNYIGGRGYASKVLYDENPPNVDPLSPENRLIIATGPLTGRAAPAAGRYMVVTKSPLTGYIASSNSGGFWGAELAKTGLYPLQIEKAVFFATEEVFILIHESEEVDLVIPGHKFPLRVDSLRPIGMPLFSGNKN